MMMSLLMNVLQGLMKVYCEMIDVFYKPKGLYRYCRGDDDCKSVDGRLNRVGNKSMYYMLDGYQQIVVIGSLDAAKTFYQSPQYKGIIRTYPYLGYVLEKLLVNSLGVHHGKDWLQMKKPLEKFFTTRSFRANYDMIVTNTEEWVNQTFKDNAICKVQDLSLDRLVIKIMSHIIYGSLTDDQTKELHELSILHNEMMGIMGTDMFLRFPIFYKYFPSENKARVDNFWQRWYSFNESIIPKDHEITLFQSMHSDPRYIENKIEFYQTLYEIMLFNLDIMIDAFANLIWNVASHPPAKDSLYEEMKKVLPGASMTLDDLSQLNYLQCVINECARLHPGIKLTFPETLPEEMLLNEMHLPKGTMISLDTEMINRDPSKWMDANQFRPERFQENPHLIYAYHRFGLSSRKCLGNVFADLILKIGLIQLLKRFDCVCVEDKAEVLTQLIQTIPNIANYQLINQIRFVERVD
jgi:cytochrome P450